MNLWEKAGIVTAIVGVATSVAFSSYNTWDGNRKYYQNQERIELKEHRIDSLELTREYSRLMKEVADFVTSEELANWQIEEAEEFRDTLLDIYARHVRQYNEAEDNQDDLYRYKMAVVSFDLNFFNP